MLMNSGLLCAWEGGTVWAPCYHPFELHLDCLGPVPCSFLSHVLSGCSSDPIQSCSGLTGLNGKGGAGAVLMAWRPQHPLSVDTTGQFSFTE